MGKGNRRKERGTEAYKEQRKVLSLVFREFEDQSKRVESTNRVNSEYTRLTLCQTCGLGIVALYSM
jgi:hypothetical protein